MSTEARSALRTFNPARIKFLHAVVTRGAIHTDDKFFNNPVQPVRTNINVSATFGFNTSQNLVRVMIQSSFFGLSSEGEPVGITGTYEINFQMTVDNMDEFIIRSDDGKEMFNHQIAVVMVSVAYSTARGMVLERTLGTIMGGVFLPVVDANALLVPSEGTPQAPEPSSSAEPTPKKAAKKK